jgi:hypothetical protein
MSTITEVLDLATANRRTLEYLRIEGVVTPDDPLALNVEAKVESGAALTPAEMGILRYGITRDALDFLRQHSELIKSVQ